MTVAPEKARGLGYDDLVDVVLFDVEWFAHIDWSLVSLPADPAWLTAARIDARRINIGWAIVWTPTPVILDYLQAVGLQFDYRADGALVYRLTTPHSRAGHNSAR